MLRPNCARTSAPGDHTRLSAALGTRSTYDDIRVQRDSMQLLDVCTMRIRSKVSAYSRQVSWSASRNDPAPSTAHKTLCLSSAQRPSISPARVGPPSVFGPAGVSRNQVIASRPSSHTAFAFIIRLSLRLFRGHAIQPPATQHAKSIHFGPMSPNLEHWSTNIPGITVLHWFIVTASQLKGLSYRGRNHTSPLPAACDQSPSPLKPEA